MSEHARAPAAPPHNSRGAGTHQLLPLLARFAEALREEHRPADDDDVLHQEMRSEWRFLLQLSTTAVQRGWVFRYGRMLRNLSSGSVDHGGRLAPSGGEAVRSSDYLALAHSGHQTSASLYDIFTTTTATSLLLGCGLRLVALAALSRRLFSLGVTIGRIYRNSQNARAYRRVTVFEPRPPARPHN